MPKGVVFGRLKFADEKKAYNFTYLAATGKVEKTGEALYKPLIRQSEEGTFLWNVEEDEEKPFYIYEDEETQEYSTDASPFIPVQGDYNPYLNALMNNVQNGKAYIHNIYSLDEKDMIEMMVEDGIVTTEEHRAIATTSIDKKIFLESAMQKSVDELIAKASSPETKERLQEILSSAVRFHNYSLNNLFLIQIQSLLRNENVSLIASFQKWKSIKTEHNVSVFTFYNKNDDSFGVSFDIANANSGEDEVSVYVLSDKKAKAIYYKESKVYEKIYELENFIPKEADEEEPLFALVNNILRRYKKSLEKIFSEDMDSFVERARKEKEFSINEFLENFELEVSPAIKKGVKGYKVLVPITKSVTVEQTVYVTDENGDTVLDENGEPVPLLDDNGEVVTQKIKEKRLVGFKLGNVFDISQTNALELGFDIKALSPTAKVNAMVKAGEVEINEFFVKEIVRHIEESLGVEVHFKAELREHGGYAIPNNGVIVINETVSDTPAKQLHVLFHELGHCLMHKDIVYEELHKSRADKELEAELFAGAMCTAFGVDTKENSSLYLSSWLPKTMSKEEKREVLLQRLQTVRNAIGEVQNRLDVIDFAQKLASKRKKKISNGQKLTA